MTNPFLSQNTNKGVDFFSLIGAESDNNSKFSNQFSDHCPSKQNIKQQNQIKYKSTQNNHYQYSNDKISNPNTISNQQQPQKCNKFNSLSQPNYLRLVGQIQVSFGGIISKTHLNLQEPLERSLKLSLKQNSIHKKQSNFQKKLEQKQREANKWNCSITQILRISYDHILKHLKSSPLLSPIPDAYLNKIWQGFDFFNFNQSRQNMFHDICSRPDHSWAKTLKFVAQSFKIDIVLSFYILIHVCLKMGIIKDFPQIFRNRLPKIQVADSILKTEVQKFIVEQKRAIVKIYSILLINKRPSDYKYVKKQHQINIIKSIARNICLSNSLIGNNFQQYDQLTRQIVDLLLDYWKKSPEQDKQIFLKELLSQVSTKIQNQLIKGKLNSPLMIYDIKHGQVKQNSYGRNFIKYYFQNNCSEQVIKDGIRQLQNIQIDEDLLKQIQITLNLRDLKQNIEYYRDNINSIILELQFQVMTIIKLPKVSKQLIEIVKRNIKQIELNNDIFTEIYLLHILNSINVKQFLSIINDNSLKAIKRISKFDKERFDKQQEKGMKLLRTLAQINSQKPFTFAQLIIQNLNLILSQMEVQEIQNRFSLTKIDIQQYPSHFLKAIATIFKHCCKNQLLMLSFQQIVKDYLSKLNYMEQNRSQSMVSVRYSLQSISSQLILWPKDQKKHINRQFTYSFLNMFMIYKGKFINHQQLILSIFEYWFDHLIFLGQQKVIKNQIPAFNFIQQYAIYIGQNCQKDSQDWIQHQNYLINLIQFELSIPQTFIQKIINISQSSCLQCNTRQQLVTIFLKIVQSFLCLNINTKYQVCRKYFFQYQYYLSKGQKAKQFLLLLFKTHFVDPIVRASIMILSGYDRKNRSQIRIKQYKQYILSNELMFQNEKQTQYWAVELRRFVSDLMKNIKLQKVIKFFLFVINHDQKIANIIRIDHNFIEKVIENNIQIIVNSAELSDYFFILMKLLRTKKQLARTLTRPEAQSLAKVYLELKKILLP